MFYYSNVKFSQPTIALPTNHNHNRVLLKLREVIIVYFAQLCLTRNAEVHWPIGEGITKEHISNTHDNVNLL